MSHQVQGHVIHIPTELRQYLISSFSVIVQIHTRGQTLTKSISCFAGALGNENAEQTRTVIHQRKQ